MRRILIILLIICLLVGTAIGGAWWYLQRTLAALPIADLDYRITVLSYKHMRLEHLSFTYIGEDQLSHTNPATDQNRDETGAEKLVESEQFHAPVHLSDVFITWEWRAFRPELQIVEVGDLTASLNRWPRPQVAEPPDRNWRDWQLPNDWRVPQGLPHRLQIEQFSLQLPCADDNFCVYSGSMEYSSQNKERFLQIGDPQNTSLMLRLSPHRKFSELQHIHLQLDYDVINDLPVFSLALISPMAFNLHWSQHLTLANRLRGELQLHYEPTGEWLVDHAAAWYPALTELAAPYLDILSDSFQLTTDYDMHLPGTSLERWLDEASGELNLTAGLQNQFDVDGRFGLERNDAIDVHARLHGQIENVFVQQVFRQLPFDWVPTPRGSASPLNLQTIGERPGLLLSQWGNTLDLRSYLQMRLPPGMTPASWASQAVGRFDYTIEPVTHYIAELATFRSASHGRVEFDAGILNSVDVALHSEIVPALSNTRLAELGVDIDQLSVALQVQQDAPMLWDEIPLALQVSTQGKTLLSLTAPTQLSLAPLSISSDSAILNVRQPNLLIAGFDLDQPQINLPFAFSLVPQSQFNLHSTAAGNWAVNRLNNQPDSDDSVAMGLEQLQGSIPSWQVQGTLADLAATQLNASLDTTAERLLAPFVQPVSWRHQAEISGQPLADAVNLQMTGQLTNAPGLSVRHQALLNSQQLNVDWQLADIFWLAGNPLIQSFEGWPELLQLERGRTSASGSLVIPFANGQSMQVEGSLLMSDVAGIYDTFIFNGLNAELDVEIVGDALNASVNQASLQRLEAGIPMGPGQLSARYQAQINAPMQGQLFIDENQLNFLNGTVSVRPDVFALGSNKLTFYLDLSQLDIARLLAQYPATEIQGSGLVSGVLPIQWSPDGFFVEEGVVASHPPGGQIQYRSERVRQMAESNMFLDIVMQALDDFHYSELSGTVGYSEDGKLSLGLLLEGQNPALEQGRPIRLEVAMEEDLPALLTSLQLVNQLNEVIQERVQQRLIERLRN